MKIGIISDTHGLLRPQVLTALAGVDHILHAGDIGNDLILPALEQIAAVTAIRGNVDWDGDAAKLPATEAVELGGRLFYLVHSLQDLDIDPAAAGVAAVIFGHSHKPGFESRKGVLYLNPGSCGPRRFSLPTTLALLNTDDMQAKLIDLLGL